MDNFLPELKELEQNEKKLQMIKELEENILTLKQKYSREYSNEINVLLHYIREKMEQNINMKNVVETYVNRYCNKNQQEEAREQLYNLLSAEIIQIIQTITRTNCIIN